MEEARPLVIDLGERLKRLAPRLGNADRSDSDTHLHHAVFTVLAGAVTALAFLIVGVWVHEAHWQDGARFGSMVGLLAYVIREWDVRTKDRRYKVWDGIGDVLYPAWIVGPVVLESFVALWILTALVALHLVLRPEQVERWG